MFIFVSFNTFIGEMSFVRVQINPLKISYSGLGSVIKFVFKCEDMSEERSSSLKLWVAVSDMTRFCIYLGLCGLSLRISSFTNHGKWSEISLLIIDEEMFVWSKCGDLQNIWSMRAQYFFDLRVGRVILGKIYWYPSDKKTHQISLFHLLIKYLYWN